MKNSKVMAAVILGGMAGMQLSAATYTWTPTAGGSYSWDDPVSNWTSGFPNAVGDVANITVDIAGPQTINLNQAITLGTLSLNDTGASGDSAYTLAAGTAGSLNFEVPSGSASLTSNGAANVISSPITFTSNTTIATTSALTLSGPLSGSGTITRGAGAAALTLSGNNSSFTGNWILSANSQNATTSISADNNLGAVPGSATTNITSTNLNAITFTATLTLNANRSINITGGQLNLNPVAATTATIDGQISGVGNLAQAGNGGSTLALTNAANDFTGNVHIVSGNVTLNFSSIGNVGAASALGAGTFINFGNSSFGGGGMATYTGSAAASSDKTFRLSATAGGGQFGISNNGSGALTLTSTADVMQNSQTTARTATLGGSNTGANTFSQKINANGTGAVNLVKSGGGYWKVLNEGNDYTGTTTISGGVLEVTKLADGGVASTIGASANTASNLVIGNSNGVLNSTLRYTGGGDNSDRLLTVGANNGSGMTGTVESSGSGALNLTNTGSLAWGTANQVRTLQLGGSNTGNNRLAAAIANNGTAAVTVVKADAGKWILAGTNTYTGATTISAGTLLVEGSISGAGAVNLAAGATFGGSGSVAGLVTTAGTSSVIAPGGSIDNSLTLGGGLNAASGGSFNFELGTSPDSITTTAFTGSLAANGLVFNFSDGGGLAAGNAYTLLTFSSVAGLDYSDLLANVLPAGYVLDSAYGTGGFLFDSTTLKVQFSAVPEPSTYLMVGAGLASLWLLKRRRNKVS